MKVGAFWLEVEEAVKDTVYRASDDLFINGIVGSILLSMYPADVHLMFQKL